MRLLERDSEVSCCYYVISTFPCSCYGSACGSRWTTYFSDRNFLEKMANRPLGKNCKKLSIEGEAWSVGWDEENIENTRSAQHLGWGLDATGRVFAKTVDKPKNFVSPRNKGSGRPRSFIQDVLDSLQFIIEKETPLQLENYELASKSECSV